MKNEKWVLSKHTTGEGEPVIKLSNGLWVATTCIDANGSGERVTANDARQNAELIVATQNLCVTLNPDNPLAAANALADAVTALKEAQRFILGAIQSDFRRFDVAADARPELIEKHGTLRVVSEALAALKGGDK